MYMKEHITFYNMILINIIAVLKIASVITEIVTLI